MICDFIAICDDNEKLCNAIKKEITSLFPNMTGAVFSFYDYPSLKNFLESKKNRNGIILMDIVLGNDNGIDCVLSLSDLSTIWKFIFITGYTDYLSEVFNASPSGLLYKPIDNDHLKNSIELVMGQLEKEASSLISINLGKSGDILLNTSKIIYLESDKRVIKIHLDNGDSYSCYMKLNDLAELLPENFVSCHKSYVINTFKIKKYSNNILIMNNETEIPVSRSHKQAVKNLFFQNMFN